MDRAALFVDAGYLLAAAGSLVAGTSKRSELEIRVRPLIHDLVELVGEDGGLPLLRTYWYDASRGGRLTDEQVAVRDSPFVKLRLGRTNSAGQQKGVDALLFKDLTMLAQQGAMCIAYLVAGDGDMVEAVRMAEDLGVQVVLISVIAAGDSGVSDDLIAEVDKDVSLDEDFLKPYIKRRRPAVSG